MNGNTYSTREEWLLALTNLLRPVFAAHGHAIPANLRVATSFPSRKALNGVKNQTIGQCWSPAVSGDGHHEVMVSPVLGDPMQVAGVLAHELVHAAVGVEHGHVGPFRKLALAIGLEGKMTATTAGEAFKRTVQPMLEAIGPYPHAALDARARNSGPKKQGTRLVKLACGHCGYTVRTTRKWLDEVGAPHCPLHGEMDE